MVGALRGGLRKEKDTMQRAEDGGTTVRGVVWVTGLM